MVIRRDKHFDKLISCKWNGMIKVVVGMRRLGKGYQQFSSMGSIDPNPPRGLTTYLLPPGDPRRIEDEE